MIIYNLYLWLHMLQTMYDSMKFRVENAVQRGKVGDEYIAGEEERKAFLKWTDGSTRQNHPTVIQVRIVNMVIIYDPLSQHIWQFFLININLKNRRSPNVNLKTLLKEKLHL
jgi:hypothetical protein